ncbi:hypothetical protein CRM22_011413 [Opisthorchis felineus]|uniref:CUB domain-containing protein n=1 Tax=Opisthorchis felineus TaxID=147828 RepID=A0A4S2JEP4_OPIFE|nr:hypothetical protein CRM22_011413 [Opisthorchis felineus]
MENSAALLGKWTGTELPPVVSSTSNYLHINMTSDRFIGSPGFSASFTTDPTSYGTGPADHSESSDDLWTEATPLSCNHILQDLSANISSPNFPLSYDNNMNCSWNISVLDGCMVGLNFTHFDLQFGKDNLTVYDGHDRNFQHNIFTGRRLPRPIWSTTNHLFLEMNTDSTVARSGFFATYTTICVDEELPEIMDTRMTDSVEKQSSYNQTIYAP